jgi:hypothetical protein
VSSGGPSTPRYVRRPAPPLKRPGREMGPGTAPKERNVGLTRRRRRRRQVVLERHPDDLPKRGLFTEPIRITRLEALEPETQEDGTTRVTFLVEVKDAEDKRCSDLAVDARVSGPDRTATVQGSTDMFGRVRVRMTGPPGHYEIEVLEVAAKGLDWDATAGPTSAAQDVPA